jgi:LPS-assembly lipoprotein
MRSMADKRNALPRRGFLAGAAAVAAVSLAGCGFELRKAPVYAFKTISIPGASAFVIYLRRNIRAGGTVEVIPADKSSTAEAILEILSENREQIVVSTNAAGLVRELQLRLTLRFRLRTPAGKELLPPTEIQQQRDVTYSENQALGKEGEIELLFRDMQNDIAQQTMRRLAAVKEL